MPIADCCATPVEVPELLEVPLPGALVLPLLVEPEVVPVVLLPGALVLPLVVPAVLLVVPDDLFDVPLLTGAVSPSALLEENPSPRHARSIGRCHPLRLMIADRSNRRRQTGAASART